MGIGRDNGKENEEKQEEQKPVSPFRKAKRKRLIQSHAGKTLRRVPWTPKVSLVAHQQLHMVLLMVLAGLIHFLVGEGFFGCLALF